MPNITLRRLILWVHDPVTLSDWYRTAFGWPITVDERAEGWIELAAGEGMSVAVHAGGPGAGQHWPKLQMQVDQVAETRAALIAAGIPMGEIQRWKHMEWSEGVDPEGNVFQVVNR